LGVYLNPDEIELKIREQGFLDFGAHGVTTIDDEVLAFFKSSPFLAFAGFGAAATDLAL
jgi:hypothetical protein